MNIPLEKINPLYIGGGLLALWFFTRPKEAGKAAGEFVVGTVSGVVSGAGSAIKGIADGANSALGVTPENCAKARADNDVWGMLTKCSTSFPNVKKSGPKSKPVSTLPGGGLSGGEYGPSFNDILNDPYGLGTFDFNYWGLDVSPKKDEYQAPVIVSVGGIRG